MKSILVQVSLKYTIAIKINFNPHTYINFYFIQYNLIQLTINIEMILMKKNTSKIIAMEKRFQLKISIKHKILAFRHAINCETNKFE